MLKYSSLIAILKLLLTNQSALFQCSIALKFVKDIASWSGFSVITFQRQSIILKSLFEQDLKI